MSGVLDKLGPLAPVHAAGLGAIGLVAVAAWLVVVRPSSAQEHERELLIRRLAEAEPRLIELETTLARTRAETDAARRAHEARQDKLGGPELRNARLTSLTQLADECGLRIDRMEPGAIEREGMYLVMPIRIEGVGGYPRCARFLSLLIERFSDMNAVAFSLDAEAGAGARPARFGFDLDWYADPAGHDMESPDGSLDG